MKYVRIDKENKVHEIMIDSQEVLDKLKQDPDLTLIDVSGYDPKPAGGWTFESGVFIAPVPKVKPPKPQKVIPKFEFMDRLTEQEQAAFMASADPVLEMLKYDFINRTRINLLGPKIAGAVEALYQKGIIAESRKAELLEVKYV